MNEADRKNMNAFKSAIETFAEELLKLNKKLENQDAQIHQLREQIAAMEAQRTAEFIGKVGMGATA